MYSEVLHSFESEVQAFSFDGGSNSFQPWVGQGLESAGPFFWFFAKKTVQELLAVRIECRPLATYISLLLP